ncbi:hypothetical protein J6590_004570 [Homalodisca vitripennis]|nr:hypothetical protein J6590_004570 [Homalodisca vitripennis]
MDTYNADSSVNGNDKRRHLVGGGGTSGLVTCAEPAIGRPGPYNDSYLHLQLQSYICVIDTLANC